MISKLHIKNIGIIEEIEIDFNKGLNVLTGETGAGKTLVIGSLGIIAGGRFSKEMIRKGEKTSYVELCIFEPESKDSIDGNIIISREINISGKNMCKINGRMVTVNELKNFMKSYIEIHEQNENQDLLDVKEHQKYLDEYIGKDLVELKSKYLEYYMKYNEIKKELKINFGDEKERQRKIDLLNYQINEIEMANLKESEENELEEKRKIILNSEKISQSLNEANELIGENTIEALSNSIRALEKIEQLDEKYKDTVCRLKSTYYELQEVSRDVSNFKEDIYFNEEERNEIEERLDLIYSLKRKYGNSIKEILEYCNQTKKEVERIENMEEHNNKLKIEKEKIKNLMLEIAIKIHNIRQKKSIEFSNKINKNLQDLEMKNAKINIHVNYKETEYYSTGKDEILMYISTNLGEDEKELSKIASGGEMSRVMLAIKTVLANEDKMPILVFDEIDTGISGKAANSVAEKLSRIAKKHQVLCISHLPNIAAKADYNYFISKSVKGDRTNTSIKLLNEKEVINEIARISSGEVNDATIRYACELRNKKVI